MCSLTLLTFSSEISTIFVSLKWSAVETYFLQSIEVRRIIIATHECGVVIVSVASVRVCVCVSVCRALTFESLGLETSFLVRRSFFTMPRSSSYVKVIGSRSRSQEQKN